MKKTRLAIIGLGMAVKPHALSLRDLEGEVEVAAAFSPSNARRETFVAEHGFPACTDSEAIFADPTIDAVMLLTPPNTHLDLVRRAAAAGKHILLEKPLETSLERAEQLVAVAEAANVKLAIVLQHRFRPVSVALAKRVSDGRLGTLVGASAKLSNWRPQSYYDQPGRGTKARDGGGVLLTQAIHTLDLIISLTGLPAEVTAWCTTTPVHAMETEDLAVGLLRFANGALGSISATTCAYPGYPDEIELICTKGTARLVGTSLSVRFHDGTELTLTDEAAGGGTGADPMAFPHEHHRAVLADFLSSVRTGVRPKVDGREALKVHRLIAAILRSSETGSAQTLAPL